jgi:hypothetical protein
MTAVITGGALALLLAVCGGLALVTRTEPLVSEPGGRTVVSEQAVESERPWR